MTDPHADPASTTDDEPETPFWLPALGFALFVLGGLAWAVTPPAQAATPAALPVSAPSVAPAPPPAPPPSPPPAAIPPPSAPPPALSALPTRPVPRPTKKHP
jgi:hypothetical protein